MEAWRKGCQIYIFLCGRTYFEGKDDLDMKEDPAKNKMAMENYLLNQSDLQHLRMKTLFVSKPRSNE